MSIQNCVDIVPELKTGSTRALHAIHDLYYSSLRNFAGGMLGDVPAAEDIVTDVFVILWKKHQDFESLSNIKAFLYISTRNACINYVKKVQRDSLMKTGLKNYLLGDHEEFVLNEMIRTEVMQQIYAAIEALPCQCRRVVKMCYIEGLNNSEIAGKFKISVNTVKNHKVRALGLLRLKFLQPSSVSVVALCFGFFHF
ncbi:MAG TPA: RNA polymerase sigma-70 factor [Puia sp.]|jgi:RNA polymerase sigma-70 factor (ECF subfamily)|nr:RNA polymerase sigma-70 factor [Puia sp.]